MASIRTKSWLMAWGLQLLLATTVMAQSEPDFLAGVGDFQIFDQPNLSEYGLGRPLPSGWWGSAEIITWNVSNPDRSLIGNPNVPVVTLFGQGSSTVNTGNIAFNNNAAPAPQFTGEPSSYFPPTGAGVTPFAGVIPLVTQGEIVNGIEQRSSYDTGWMQSRMETGGRYEFGYTEGAWGWFVSSFMQHDNSQEFVSTNVAVNFETGPIAFLRTTIAGQTFDLDLDGDNVFGRSGRDRGTPQGNNFVPPLDGRPDGENAVPIPTDFDDAVAVPTVFEDMQIRNTIEIYGVEVNGMYRNATERLGGRWEFFAGPRYLYYGERFNVFTSNFETNSLSFFDDTEWNTEADNHLVGGQFGTRWIRERGRLSWIVESRFMPAANFQSIRQQGIFRSRVANFAVTNLPATAAFESSIHPVEFSLLGEVRAKVNYQIWRSLGVSVGWTGMYMDGIARPSDMVIYRLPSFGIDQTANRQNVFVNGLDVGLTLKR